MVIMLLIYEGNIKFLGDVNENSELMKAQVHYFTKKLVLDYLEQELRIYNSEINKQKSI